MGDIGSGKVQSPILSSPSSIEIWRYSLKVTIYEWNVDDLRARIG